jgi:hypothetical protein
MIFLILVPLSRNPECCRWGVYQPLLPTRTAIVGADPGAFLKCGPISSAAAAAAAGVPTFVNTYFYKWVFW